MTRPDLDGMVPDTDPRKERVRRWARTGICVAMIAMTVLLLSHPRWGWVTPVFCGTVAGLSTVARSGELPGHRWLARGGERGGGGRGRDDGRPAGVTATHRWPSLVLVSRLMPRPAGRRWLAEAESLLSEISSARRRAAVRSYLLSAPRLSVTMWALAARRRARTGPRRPR